MASPVEELLGMLGDAGVSHEIVSASHTLVIVTMPDAPDGWFEITPAAPSPDDDRGVQWHVHRYLLPDGLAWSAEHSSAGVVDQIRSGLFGRPTPLPDADEGAATRDRDQ